MSDYVITGFVSDGFHIRRVGKELALCNAEMSETVHNLTLKEFENNPLCPTCKQFMSYLMRLEEYLHDDEASN